MRYYSPAPPSERGVLAGENGTQAITQQQKRIAGQSTPHPTPYPTQLYKDTNPHKLPRTTIIINMIGQMIAERKVAGYNFDMHHPCRCVGTWGGVLKKRKLGSDPRSAT
jgi:hypothetical protein